MSLFVDIDVSSKHLEARPMDSARETLDTRAVANKLPDVSTLRDLIIQ